MPPQILNAITIKCEGYSSLQGRGMEVGRHCVVLDELLLIWRIGIVFSFVSG